MLVIVDCTHCTTGPSLIWRALLARFWAVCAPPGFLGATPGRPAGGMLVIVDGPPCPPAASSIGRALYDRSWTVGPHAGYSAATPRHALGTLSGSPHPSRHWPGVSRRTRVDRPANLSGRYGALPAYP